MRSTSSRSSRTSTPRSRRGNHRRPISSNRNNNRSHSSSHSRSLSRPRGHCRDSAAAAALAAVCISLGVENKNLSDTVNAESGLLTTLSAKAAHAQQIVDVLNAPNAQRVTLTLTKHSADPTGHAVYLPDRGSLLFEANNLKPLDPGKTYELWVIPADGKAPLPAGTFKPDAAGYASVVLPTLPPGVGAKAFGVTIEKDGGATTPTMPIVLAGG